MLTVKLIQRPTWATTPGVVTKQSEDPTGRFTTKIIEADEVNIHILRPGEVTEVAAMCGNRNWAFLIADPNKPRPDGFAAEVDFWFVAYIENSQGATTEVVKF